MKQHNPIKLKRFTLDNLITTPKSTTKNGKVINYSSTRLEKFFPINNFHIEVAIFSRTINVTWWYGENYKEAIRTQLPRNEYKNTIGNFLHNLYLIESGKENKNVSN